MADFVQAELGDRPFLQGVDVNAVTQVGNFAADHAGGLLDPIALAPYEGFLGHPDDHRFDLRRNVRLFAGMNEHVAPAHVDFVFEREGDGHRSEGFFQFAVVGDDGFYFAAFAGGERP